MSRRQLVLIASLALAFTVLPAAAADAFNPATQSHPGACSQETTSVTRAVHDYSENGVLLAFAGLVGIHGSTGAVTRRMDSELVLGTVVSRAITENHGCEGVGDWFSVGLRTLNAGEHVGVRVPAKLRSRLCSRPSSGCKHAAFDAHVVFPTNCWNPNFGRVRVAVYVHKAKVVPKSYKKRYLPKRQVAPARVTPTPAATPTPVTPVAIAAPSATDKLECSAGGVVVTLSNGASATASASFTVNGKSYGPLAAGTSEAVTIPIAPGASATLMVSSGGSTLIESHVTNTCSADPKVVIGPPSVCRYEPPGGYYTEVEVELENAPSATLPAFFTIEWPVQAENPITKEPEVKMESESFGPLSPGATETATIRFEPFPESTIEVTSEGKQIAHEEFGDLCLL